jgi:hypothetical protein
VGAPLIEVTSLEKTYATRGRATVQALAGISLAIAAGEFVAIVFAVLILLSVMGVTLHLIMQAIQRRVIFWAEPEQVIDA